ncbi:membrane protein insertase YidC [Mycoplasmopsis phocirhinis]|uniref:Membrane protein insertase YidC n=1 Tax=Mycoplasmopsis phocirhinis TaxID=142650 RepID=A0A4P6MN76_9BACT|nr:membrane protein insertase YidC [Mycoplasmopsis phocirhinis]QBF34330.1 membrane protein insertase YidC [Mycoplasmopsis phocirhinis]
MQNRSKNFDYFKSNQNDNKSKKNKDIRKKAWLIIKIILYVLLFALTLTGCVQTIVVKSSNLTGSGTEFYTSRNQIAPKVATFERANKPKNDNILQKGEFYELNNLPEANYHLAYKNYKDVLVDLQKQVGEQNYGLSGVKTSSIQYVLPNGDFIETQYKQDSIKNPPIIRGENGNYLFTTSHLINASDYNSIYDNWTAFSVLDPDFQFANLFTKNEEGYVVNKDALIMKHPENKELSLKNATLFSVFNNRDGYKTASGKYARDVLEFLYRETFLVQNNVYQRTFANESYESIMTKILNGDIQKISTQQYEVLSNYDRVVKKYLNQTNLDKTISKLPLLDKNGVNKYDKKGDLAFSQLSSEKSVLGSPFSVDLNNNLPFAASEVQIPFYSFNSTLSYGPFFSFVIYPIAALTIAIRNPLPVAAGWSTILVILIAVVVTRLISLAITWKATMSQTMQEELRVKKAKIDAKYAEYKGNKEMRMRQQQEVSELYKKNGISPMDSILSLIISIPIFIAMWRVIQSVPELKSTTWLGLDFAATSYKRLFAGEWWYLFLLLFTAGSQLLSMLVPRFLNKRNTKHMTIEQKQAMKKNDKTQWIMMIVFLFITLIFSAGVQIYWVATNLWSIAQSIAIHHLRKTKFFQKKYNKKIRT